MPLPPFFSLDNINIVNTQKTIHLTGEMISDISHVSEMINIEPEKVKGYLLIAIVDSEDNTRISQYSDSGLTRTSIYGIMPFVQKMLIDNYRKEINPEGLV